MISALTIPAIAESWGRQQIMRQMHDDHGQMGMGRMNMSGIGDNPVYQSFDAEMGAGMTALHAEYDADQAGRASERPFAMLDADGDGQISAEEMTFPAQMMARMNRMHWAALDAGAVHH